IMAIGDYYNDLELIETAAVGAVPAGAPDDLKQCADLVVCSCENGAVADFIEYIEATYQ
ncbi:MAG: HAD hydrolase family protein, partial [Clostridiales bacterium]|nr:HAD hydrolase family protein [Clostridiales bacterium]